MRTVQHLSHRLSSLALAFALGALALLYPHNGLAATADVELLMHPHCESYANEVASGCTMFKIEDPETFEAPLLDAGDTVDFDIVIKNPSRQSISHVRAWINYDPSVLSGTQITVRPAFPVTTPGELDFAPSEGLVKIEVEAEEGSSPTNYWIPVARVQFTVTERVSVGTVLSFFDVSEDGHTFVLVNEAGSEAPVLSKEPASLLVPLGDPSDLEDGGDTADPATPVSSSSSASSAPAQSADNSSLSDSATAVGGDDTEDSEQTETDTPSEDTGVPQLSEGELCAADAECATGLCQNGLCRDPNVRVPMGGACLQSDECQSGFCVAGVCRDPNDSQAQRTAFSLLQIRNLRVTSEADVVYLGWEPTQSSILKAYNVYYGTTSGRYIHRKTIPSVSPTLTIRNLPANQQYFFAVRAVNTMDEESAFSQEVGIVVGDPASSTAPLVANITTDAPRQNPVRPQGTTPTTATEVPGETGSGTILALFLLASAAIGTLVASRRQLKLAAYAPQS